MRLTDIKKLKVAELRSRLGELGLNTRGLKAELVDRLWSSSSETGLSEEDGEEEVKLQHVNSTTETPALHAAPSSPPTAAGVPARCEADREFTDSATQTETGPPALQPGFEVLGVCHPGRGAEGELESRKQPAGSPEKESRGPLAEDTGRGRAFYEFKEEIRYKRWRYAASSVYITPVQRGQMRTCV